MKMNSKIDTNLHESSTVSFIKFGREVEQFELLLFYMKVGDSLIADNLEDSIKRIISYYKDSEEDDHFIKIKTEKYLDINYYENNLSGMIYVRALDNFITYFKDILSEIVIKRPQVLKSKDTEKLDFILEHENMESLLQSIAEKKIAELFYKGLKDIQKFFSDRLNIDIFKEEKKSDEINLLIKQRNLAVHNRGIITKEMVNEFPENNFIEGLVLSFNFQYVLKINDHLYNIINDLDIELSKKYNLEQIKL